MNANTNVMSKVLKPAPIEASRKFVQSRREAVTTLKAQLGRDVPIIEVKQKLMMALETECKMELIKGELTDEEKSLAQKLYKERYSNSEYAILLEVDT